MSESNFTSKALSRKKINSLLFLIISERWIYEFFRNLFQQKKKEQLENQEKDLTFKPKLKQTMLSQFKVNRKVDSIAEHLMQMGKKNKENREKMQAEKQKEETQGCSFRPHIDPM